jgi:hypothetical protein
MISEHYITGMAPYGHGEESRPNNLTYVITCNSGHVDTDLTDRCLYIYVEAPKQENMEGWTQEITAYIKNHRMNIMADMIDLLRNHKRQPLPKLSGRGRVRFADFAAQVIAPCCGSQETFTEVLNHALATRSESNSDEDMARCINDHFTFQINKLNIDPLSPIFITTQVCNSWGRKAIQESGQEFDPKSEPIQLVRNLSKTGLLKNADASIKRWPQSSSFERYSGVAWNFTPCTIHATIVCKDGDGNLYAKTSTQTTKPNDTSNFTPPYDQEF